MIAVGRPVRTLMAGGALLAACAPSADPGNASAETFQTMSLSGDSLFDRMETDGDSIGPADAARAGRPDDLDLLLNAARARDLAWRYRQSIELYSRAAELAPTDWRPVRFRGHRWISLRAFDRAAADLERARMLAPHSFDVAYHLGLAYYLQGRFGDAADEYGRCMALADAPGADATADTLGYRACEEIARRPASLVAMAEWRRRALARAGRSGEIPALLERVDPAWEVTVNASYFASLLMARGDRGAETVLDDEALGRFETRAYGVAVDRLVAGESEAARELLERIAADPHWPGFGRIAAEVDLTGLP